MIYRVEWIDGLTDKAREFKNKTEAVDFALMKSFELGSFQDVELVYGRWGNLCFTASSVRTFRNGGEIDA